MKFHTEDGFTLELKNGVWTDGDLSFRSREGWPVGEDGEPLSGKIEYPKLRMFKSKEGFGFVGNDKETLFLHITGLRIPKPGYERPWSYDFPTEDEAKRIRDGLHEGVEILILKQKRGPKGIVAEQWTLVDLHNDPVDLYVVFERQDDTSTKTEEGQDKERKMWTTTITRNGVVTFLPVMASTNISEVAFYVHRENHVVYRCHTKKRENVMGLVGYSTRFRTFKEVSAEEVDQLLKGEQQ